MKDRFKSQYGPWAIVTGASSGLGETFGDKLAQLGLNIVLVARRKKRLEDNANQLIKRHQVDCRVVCADLSKDNFIDLILKKTEDLPIGLLVNNAGAGQFGDFVDTPLTRELEILHLNCRAPLILTHTFARQMRSRKKGGIIFVSSIGGFLGISRMSHYAATKAYDLLFAEGLYHELRRYNIDVLALCPGITKTEFQKKANVRQFLPMSPDVVVEKTLKKLGKTSIIVPGKLNQLTCALIKSLPRAWGSKATDFGGKFF